MLKIVHICEELQPKKTKKLTERQQLHADTLLAIANDMAMNRLKFPNVFEKEYKALEILENEFEMLD